MGEAEPFDRETLADGPATVADDGDASACTIGAESADSRPADLGAESGDGKHATLGSGAAAGDATQGPADLAEATGAGATAMDSLGSHAGADDARLIPRTEPTFGPPPDSAAATVDGERDAGPPVAPGDAPPEAVALRAAPTIPGYEILGELGRGGMGVVYRARQVRLNRPCALKMILAGAHATPEAAARFLAEAVAVAKLQHPNIVQIFHIDEHDGFPYFEMEYVGGGSLATRLDGTPRPPREAAKLIEGLARAIGEAHRLGIVHRDLKPSNILMTPQGATKIADFGLAKLLNVDSGLTATDSILGSPSYMAPEQAEGKNKDVGPTADVYALGAILYELLTGRPPFRAATVLETLEQVKTAEPVPPSRLVPGLPRDAETIALECLQKDPGKRYESAAALAEDLRRYQAGEPIVARPVGPLERCWRWCRRNPMLAGLTAAAAALLVATAAGAAVAAVQYRLKARVEARAKEELETNLYFSHIARAQQELAADNLRGTRKLLDACPKALRDWEWDYLDRLCRVDPVVLPGQGKGVHSVAFSPDGRRLAAAQEDGTIALFDAATGAEWQTLRGHTAYVFSVAFHPEGTHLASASHDRTVTVWNLATGQPVFSRGGHGGNYAGAAYGVAFSPDGRYLAAGSDDGSLVLRSATDGQEIRRLPGDEQTAFSIAFSRDSRLLASGSGAGVLRVWEVQTGRLLHTVPGHDDLPVTAVAFRHDGRCLATAGIDRLVKVWDVATGALVRELPGHIGLVIGLAFSRDGRRLASLGAEDMTLKLWEPLTGREVLNLRGHTFQCLSLAFSPDGRRLASAGMDKTIRIWDATPLKAGEGQELLTVSHDHEVWGVAVSPDGRRLASASWDKTARLWDATTGAPLAKWRHTGQVYRVVFSPDPDGRQLLSSAQLPGGWDLVTVWDTATFQEITKIRRAKSLMHPLSALTFSPDGRYLLMEGVNHEVQVFDARTSQEIGIIGRHGSEVWCLAFSPDGRYLASASNDWTVKLWDGTRLDQSQEPLLSLPVRAHGNGNRVAFSPDSKRLVTTGEKQTVKIWDAKTGAELRTLPLPGHTGHTGDVYAVAVSPDGDWIASAGLDTTVILWDAATGERRRTLRGHTSLVSSLAFSPDSRRLVSGSRDRTVKVWDLTALGAKPGSKAAAPEE